MKKAAKKKAAKQKPAKKLPPAQAKENGAFKPRDPNDVFSAAEPDVHVFGEKRTCSTDSRGYATPNNRSPLSLLVEASEGFVPLWAKGVTLRWRFNEDSMWYFQDIEAAKHGLRELLGEALLAWGDAMPIRFRESRDVWDFEIVMQESDRCSTSGCTLARAFFPDAGRHDLAIFPKMFMQSRKEQVDTLIHETGHMFGLRHFFANVTETAWPSELFGSHRPFTTMNYGEHSELTDVDKSDLKDLYAKARSGELTEVNSTPIVLVRPYHDLANPS